MDMGDRPYHDADTLRRLYHDEGLTQQEIADKFGVADNTISKWFRKLDITSRPHQDAPYKSEDVLRYLYHDEGLSMPEIADRFDIGTSTVKHWIHKNGIETLDPNRKRYDIPEDELRDLYVDRQWPMAKCADHYGCTTPTIRSRLEEYGIPVRHRKEVQRSKHGETVSLTRHSDTGYLRWYDNISDTDVRVHSLVAIADGASPYKVFSDGDYMVHHKNTHKLDNRPDNLKVVSESQHMAIHRRNEWTERDGWPELVTATDPSA